MQRDPCLEKVGESQPASWEKMGCWTRAGLKEMSTRWAGLSGVLKADEFTGDPKGKGPLERPVCIKG
jgi:hypothetical protein